MPASRRANHAFPSSSTQPQLFGLWQTEYATSCIGKAALEQKVTVQASKFDMEGSFSPQRFIAYGALAAAPLFDDGRVYGRKDYTYMACARLCSVALQMCPHLA